jgi:hypothetical protein
MARGEIISLKKVDAASRRVRRTANGKKGTRRDAASTLTAKRFPLFLQESLRIQ